MRTIESRYYSTCRRCGGKIKPGETICWERGMGSYHVGCVDAEYAAGRADAERYLAEKEIYGEALAEVFALQDELNRYNRGEDGW